MHTPSPQRSLRTRLRIGMAVALGIGVVAFVVFSMFSNMFIRSMLRDDMQHAASLVSGMMERDLRALEDEVWALAATDSLREMAVGREGERAKAYLRVRLHAGSQNAYRNIWLLDAENRVIAAVGDDVQGNALPGVVDAYAPVFRVLGGRLSVFMPAPILEFGERVGLLMVQALYPSPTFFHELDRISPDMGLALWVGDRMVTASGWLLRTGYDELPPPLDRMEVSLDRGRGEETFLAHPLPVISRDQQAHFEGELLRSLRTAREPFMLLNYYFIMGWIGLLVLLIVFSRFLEHHFVRPVLRLAGFADFIAREGKLPQAFCDWRPPRRGTEVSNLFRAFHEMVHSLQNARVKAEEADRAKTNFLSMVSHELRTPLTSVLGFAKMARKKLNQQIVPALPQGDEKVVRALDQVEENLDIIVSEGERLTQLINDVLDLAKLESGHQEWRMERVEAVGIVERAVEVMSAMLASKGLFCRVEADPDLPLVRLDSDRIMQVLVNLLSNAIKFTDKGGVTCEVRRGDGAIIVSVADTGTGIGPEDLHQVFERFRQGGEALTDRPMGTGLGLAIARQIVEHHGGRIWLQSEPGAGTTVFFTLPVTG